MDFHFAREAHLGVLTLSQSVGSPGVQPACPTATWQFQCDDRTFSLVPFIPNDDLPRVVATIPLHSA